MRAGAAWITLNWRSHAGHLEIAGMQALCDWAETVRCDDSVRVVVLQARGPDFCLGFDPEGTDNPPDCVAAIANLPQPVAAIVAGRALAEGCELALACDIRVASTRAAFALPQVRQGRLPRYGGTQRLPRLVGPTRALEILWSGRLVGAGEARRIGLVSRVAEPRRLRPVAARLVASLCRKAPVALRLAKEAVRSGSDLTLPQGMHLEEDLYALLQTTEDRGEGIRAFQCHRQPRFKGR